MATGERDYLAWCKYHAERFGFSDSDTQLLTAWFEVLSWYDPPYLYNATTQLLRGDYPSFARDHLKALLPLVRDEEARSLRDRAKDHREDDRGTCTHCGGSGWVCDLPHLRSVLEGRWLAPYYTCATFCLCGLGRWCREHWQAADGRAVPLDLIAYDALNPAWEEQRRQYYARHQTEAKALRAARTVSAEERDRRFHLDQTLDRLAQQFRLPGQENP